MDTRYVVTAGLGVAAVGNLGWVVIIGDMGVSWPFLSFALGAAVAAAAPFLARKKKDVVWAGGWAVAAIGAVALLFDEMGRAPGSDFPAPYLYYLGFLVAAVGAVTALSGRRRLGWTLAAAGVALAAAGGLWWTGLDLVRGSWDYLWANAALGVGYGVAAAAVWMRLRSSAVERPATTETSGPSAGP